MSGRQVRMSVGGGVGWGGGGVCFFFQAEDGIRDTSVTGVQTCALPISQAQIVPLPLPAKHELQAPVRNLDLDSAFFGLRTVERRRATRGHEIPGVGGKSLPQTYPNNGPKTVQTHPILDRKSTRLNSSHRCISYAVFCLKKKKHIAQTRKVAK